MNEQSRLRWRCRRGIREMDILLQHFLETVHADLSADERRLFERLLEESDLDLLDWITGRRPLTTPDYAPLIKRLQQVQPVADT